MPCCAQTAFATGMEMPPVASAVATCHDAAMDNAMNAASTSTMSMQAAAMLHCPRAAADLQAGSEWATSEQAEVHPPLQIASNLPADRQSLRPDLRHFTRISRRSFLHQIDLSSSFPLRV